jgi:hypothetical protein
MGRIRSTLVLTIGEEAHRKRRLIHARPDLALVFNAELRDNSSISRSPGLEVSEDTVRAACHLILWQLAARTDARVADPSSISQRRGSNAPAIPEEYAGVGAAGSD